MRTCADVRALATRGIGEGPTIDYKLGISFTSRNTLTAGSKKELARDVSALANAQGGLLVIGVKDPEREGEPPASEDFVGVAVPDTFARDLESSLLGSVIPPMNSFVRVTEDAFEHSGSGERRRFVVVGVRRGSRLHQVTAGGDYRFYRRAGYQNRPLDVDEVRLRLTTEASARAKIDELVNTEADRIARVFEYGPRAAFIAVPIAPHRFAVEPASNDALRQLHTYLRMHPSRSYTSDVDVLSPGFDPSRAFVPAGDGARYFYRDGTLPVTAEVRVRQDGLTSSARDYVEMHIEVRERLWLHKPDPGREIFVEVAKEERRGLGENVQRVNQGYPSYIVDIAPAVQLDPSMLRASAKGFLRFVHQAYDFLGYLGPVRVETLVSGGDSYVAVVAQPKRVEPHMYHVSELTEMRCSIESEHRDLASREAELTEEMLTQLARHFGVGTFVQ